MVLCWLIASATALLQMPAGYDLGMLVCSGMEWLEGPTGSSASASLSRQEPQTCRQRVLQHRLPLANVKRHSMTAQAAPAS